MIQQLTRYGLITLCFLSMSSLLSAWESDSVEALELTAVNTRLTEAYAAEDIATLRAMLAEAHVHNNVFGFALTKEQFLKDIESGVLEFISYTTPELKWHIAGNTAIATGIIHAKAVRDGKPVPAERFLFTRIYTKQSGEWQVLLFHNTMAKPKGES